MTEDHASATRTRAQWAARLEGTDACFAPVLAVAQATAKPTSPVDARPENAASALNPWLLSASGFFESTQDAA